MKLILQLQQYADISVPVHNGPVVEKYCSNLISLTQRSVEKIKLPNDQSSLLLSNVRDPEVRGKDTYSYDESLIALN